jgi:hypothetical protein
VVLHGLESGDHAEHLGMADGYGSRHLINKLSCWTDDDESWIEINSVPVWRNFPAARQDGATRAFLDVKLFSGLETAARQQMTGAVAVVAGPSSTRPS